MPVSDGTSLGRLLGEERLRQHLDFAEISARTRICAKILDAIEKDWFDHIPGGWYRHSFLRQYALALGMDGEAIVAEFKKQHEEPPLPLPIPRARKPRRIWADLAWMTVGGVALTAVYYASEATHAALRRLEHAGPHEQNSLAQALPTPTLPTPTLPSSPPSEPAKAPGSAPSAAVHVTLTATEPVWVSVKYDGDVKWAGVLEVPQSKTFDANDAITAVIGNAGGLEISLNGKPVAPFGGHGEVQILELTPTGARRIPHHSD
jgi:cytoskeleton protein RodZ